MRGFVYLRDSESLLKQVIKIFVETVEKNLLEPEIDMQKISDEVKDKVERYIYHDTRRNPVIIPLIRPLD